MVYIINQTTKDIDFSTILPRKIPHKTNTLTFTKITPETPSEHTSQLYSIYKGIIEEGETYPQLEIPEYADFQAYYLSGDTFYLLTDENQVVGSFYIKPNFPGRSSHICNGGFMVHQLFRNQKIGSLLVPLYEEMAALLGYKGSFFNLVYKSNVGSVKLWEKFGFERVGVVPNGGRMKKSGWVDAYQYYKQLAPLD